MGYTDLHYAAKDGYSLAGVLLWIAFGTIAAVIFLPVTLIIGLIFLIVWLVKRRNRAGLATTEQQATGAAPEHEIFLESLMAVPGVMVGPGEPDFFTYDCSCGYQHIFGYTPEQARDSVREHLHQHIDWEHV